MNFAGINFDKEYWEERFVKNETKWDIGYISTPLKEYFDQLTNKDLKILIPGSGNGYEAEYLYNLGFKNIFIVEWSDTAIQNFIQRFPDFPSENIFQDDFFNHTGKYDLIIEQTFFCALHPSQRENYVKKTFELLSENGKLSGLLFGTEFTNPGPPFGGTKNEYVKLFEPYFDFKYFDDCYNSIPPREGSELFINLIKKENLV
ncbi:MAG: SAM-dependent methyltransferase [Bacteroidetes bacterium]|nr:SAM-dependent methyltransferase [Bacteroidota bacterium]